MGILDKDFERAIGSDEASRVRAKMGAKKGNKFIQDTNNNYHNRKGRKCGYD